MGRLVNPGGSGAGYRGVDAVKGATASEGGGNDDKYGDRLAKYVPAESIAAFLAANTIILAIYGVQLDGTVTKPGDGMAFVASLISFLAILVLTPVYLWSRREKPASPDQPAPPWKVNTAISTFAFLVWAYGLGGAFFVLSGVYSPIIAALLPILATFGLAAVKVEPPKPAGEG